MASTRVAAADTAIRTDPGILKRVVVIAPGSSGSASIWDGDVVGEETAANLRWTRASTDMKAGDVYELGIEVNDGLWMDISASGIFIIVHGDY